VNNVLTRRRLPDAPAVTTVFDEDATGLSVLSDAQFEMFRGVAKRHAGIMIADFKRSMVYRRIKRRMKALAIDDVEDYCALLSGPDGPKELQPLINVLTTNKTEFFRERHHFDHLTSTVLPRLVSEKPNGRTGKLRIWSAGCSTGEEPYSIAMSLGKLVDTHPNWDTRILATDIDTDVIDRAKKGIYRLGDTATVPRELRARYIDDHDADEGCCRMTAAGRRLITFKQLNLHEAWPFRGPFDVIFCRNVVIYFDKPTQKALFDRIADVLTPDGFLYCGHSESLYGISDRFRAIGQSIYQRIT
jgi:chemotaxis protein methyltransferase CheR